MTESAPHLRVIEETPAYWRVVFDNPPLNIMDADMFEGLQNLLARMDASSSLRVVVFESANRNFYLAHFELKDTTRTLGLLKTVGPTGLPSLLDTFVRLTTSPIVSIAKIRGRARGVASEFLLACDMRFASRENTVLGQFEVGSGVVPGGGPMARLARLAGRGRALEILLVADDLDGPRAEQYGYVNRLIADDELDDEVEAIAARLARFDHDAIARTKAHVDRVTLPADSEFPPALADFFQMLGQPRQQQQFARLLELGLNTDSDLERSLGRRVVESTPED
jgi:enoyl-CoA hydratase/carnithine racemase